VHKEIYISSTDNRHDMADKVWSVIVGLPERKRFKVDIADHKPVRSDSQNRYLWGVVYRTVIEQGKLDGWTAQDIHEYLLGEHFGWEVVSIFGKKRQRPIRRSSKLNKQEFSDYIAFIQQKMAEVGIVIPDSNE
jgi:hypothetical protein